MCPLYMLTGEYDFSCAPEDIRAAAALIAGAKVVIMDGLAHFPMSEDPAKFRTYFMPILDEIRERRGWGRPLARIPDDFEVLARVAIWSHAHSSRTVAEG